jgi:xanthine dehydrogenase YagR molybdenum-binding subunit
MAAATARVIPSPQGNAKVLTAAHDIGNRAYTVIALTASDKLGVPLDQITVEIGDSDLPPAPVAGGSNTTAGVCNVVAIACERLRDKAGTNAAVANAVYHATGVAFATCRSASSIFWMPRR